MAKRIKVSQVSRAPQAKSKEIASAHAPRNDRGFFPKIYRFITESWKLLLAGFVSVLLLIAIALQSLSLYANFQESEKLRSERGKTISELNYWKKVVGEHKNYRDGYFKIATLEYRLGNKNEAKLNLDKALELDPNFEKGRELEKILGS